ncbi:RNA polymerase sigma factor (sigma-70 family) [Catalinimonas alkaloidigena]|uniref:RagB/SusD family nutrient uptake outer membrane protein n=1 Tax=Catalinimonas alkaloidigena TaxID=1075417 RepID=UPI0024058051|nr:RagB/SusD family nutrient uptake outer membrane protein [Catalinimonas alkaloidigena]MDF9799358.1 RNA polymerase sigma factor (sigma-70 family) [Catalinimonas alkaloidigena]
MNLDKKDSQNVAVSEKDVEAFLGKTHHESNAQATQDTDLWQRFKEGSEEVFIAIYRSYFQLLYAYGHQFTVDTNMVEDCIQELFIALRVKREKLKYTNSIKFYLFKALRNRLLRKLSRKKMLPLSEQLMDGYNFEINLSQEHAIQFQTGANFPLFRYPHVLLMLAECYLRVGGGDPLMLVNQVRARAGLPAASVVTLEDIIHQRRVEFYGEADRWDVLVRTDKVLEVMEAHGENERQNRSEVHVGDAAFRDIKVLYPIPASAIQTDPKLKQNSEY